MSKTLPWLPDNFNPAKTYTDRLGAPQRTKKTSRTTAGMDAALRAMAKRRHARGR